MKQRSPLVATLLSLFIPFYILYWLYVTAADIRTRGTKAPKLALLIYPILGLLVVFILNVLVRFVFNNDTVTTIVNLVSILGGVGSIVCAIVLPFVYYYQFSEAAETTTQGKANKIAAFLLFIFISPAAVYIIQEALNTTSSTPGSHTTAPTEIPAPY